LPAGLFSVGGSLAFGRLEGRGVRVYPAVAVWKWADARDLGEIVRGPTIVQPALVVRWGQ
jgi:hypothetical protein